MPDLYQKTVIALGMMGLLAFAGCGRKPAASTPLPIEQVPQEIENAFKNAPPDASQAASEAVSAVRSDEPEALADLQDLSARPDLSEEQRIAAARAMAAYLQKLRESAEKGNKKSEAALEHYRATK